MPNPHPRRRAQARRSVAERNALVLQFDRLPRHVVKKMRDLEAVKHLGEEDAVQIGFLGLIRAAEIWDETRGVKFISYAYRAVRTTIVDAARRHMESVLAGRGVINYLPVQVGEYDYTVDVLPQPLAPIPRHDPLELREAVAVLQLLPPRWRRVVYRRYLRGETLKELGGGIGTAGESARLICKKALTWLRAHLDGRRPARPVDATTRFSRPSRARRRA